MACPRMAIPLRFIPAGEGHVRSKLHWRRRTGSEGTASLSEL